MSKKFVLLDMENEEDNNEYIVTPYLIKVYDNESSVFIKKESYDTSMTYEIHVVKKDHMFFYEPRCIKTGYHMNPTMHISHFTEPLESIYSLQTTYDNHEDLVSKLEEIYTPTKLYYVKQHVRTFEKEIFNLYIVHYHISKK